MPGVTIPDGGVILGTAPTTVGQKNLNIHSQQAMRVTFADNSILEDVLKHGADLKISFGKSMVRNLHRWASCLVLLLAVLCVAPEHSGM
jgi:hypothetical protein